jgi:hypothetical protein
MFRTPRAFCALALLGALTGCAEPPHKEMNQAQGAIDAARAAGADEYATTELAAATDALKRSEEAVAQNDYRLALSLAIDGRERAQAAAKVAVETRAKARGNAERIVAEVNAVLTQAQARLDDATLTKLPRRTATDLRARVAAAEKSMQEARTALERDDYERAITIAKALEARIVETLGVLDKATTPAPVRKRR